MIIDIADGSYFCFGCGSSGNAVDFVRQMNPKLNDLQLYRLYFRILKSKKVKQVKANLSASKKNKKDSQENREIAEDYYNGLRKVDWRNDSDYIIEVEEAREYMHKRGFDSKALNLCNAKITYQKAYPLVFPMLDNNVFKGYVCRTTNKRIEAKRKYLYNTGFSRVTTLVGNYKNTDTVVLVEGYMDMLKMRRFGIKKVVAILGWKMTREQIEKLKSEGITRVISALDNDSCGIKGTKYIKEFFEVVRWRYIDNIKDPGDFNQETFNIMYRKTKQIARKKQNPRKSDMQ